METDKIRTMKDMTNLINAILGQPYTDVAARQAKQAKIENFVKRCDRGGYLDYPYMARYCGIHHAGGYLEATTGQVAVRVRGVYEPELEGKIVSAFNVRIHRNKTSYKKGDWIEGKFPNVRGVIPPSHAEAAKKNPTKIMEETPDELIGLAAAAIAAKRVCYISGVCELRSGDRYDPEILLSAASMAKRKGFTEVFTEKELLVFKAAGNKEEGIVLMPSRESERDKFSQFGINLCEGIIRTFPKTEKEAMERACTLTALLEAFPSLRDAKELKGVQTYKDLNPLGYGVMRMKKGEMAELIGNMPVFNQSSKE